MSLPPKVLLLYAHPEIQRSIANQALLKVASQLEHVTLHDLYACYPDFFINTHHERALLLDHQVVVFQHPLYMYSCPALLNEWLDDVLCQKFARGNEGKALAGKYWRSVITTVEPEGGYPARGLGYHIDEILRPFQLIARACQMHWLPPLVIYGEQRLAPAALKNHEQEYQRWLKDPLSYGASHGK